MYQRLAGGQNDVWRQRDQFLSIFVIVFEIGRGKAMINPHIVAVGPAQLLQPLLECREAYLLVLIVHSRGREHADASHPLGLLRLRRERPRCRRAADKRDELASPHVEHATPPGPAEPRTAYRTLKLPRKQRQVLGKDLNCSESRR